MSHLILVTCKKAKAGCGCSLACLRIHFLGEGLALPGGVAPNQSSLFPFGYDVHHVRACDRLPNIGLAGQGGLSAVRGQVQALRLEVEEHI